MITTIQYAATAVAVSGMVGTVAVFPIAAGIGRIKASQRIRLIRTSTWMMRGSLTALGTLIVAGFLR